MNRQDAPEVAEMGIDERPPSGTPKEQCGWGREFDDVLCQLARGHAGPHWAERPFWMEPTRHEHRWHFAELYHGEVTVICDCGSITSYVPGGRR